MAKFHLTKTMAFNQVHTERYFINGRRVSNHEFSILLLKHRTGFGCRPDRSEPVNNGSPIQVTRYHWDIDGEAIR